MNFTQFQKLIGKNISEAHKVLGNDFKRESNSNSICFKADGAYKYFYNTPSYYIKLRAQSDVVNSITFYFHGVIDNSFYNSFIQDFGNPSTIQVIDKVKIISEGKNTEGDFVQHLKKSFVETREGTFEEKPLYLIWNKEDYQIKILLKHKVNISEITFRIPTDNF